MECNIISNKINVNKLNSDISSCIEKYLKDDIKGFFLFGSLFNGDFLPGVSDIDFIAILNKPLSAELTERIHNFCAHLKSINEIYDLLEGSFSYIPNDFPWDITCTIWKDKNKSLCIEYDSLDPDLVEYIVGKGLKVYGSDPQLIFPYVSTKRLEDFSYNYIYRIKNDIDKLVEEPNKLLKKLLNACRSAYFLCNENFAVQKSLAAKWVIEKHPQYSYLIEKALRLRQGQEIIRCISQEDKIKILELLDLMLNKTKGEKEGFNKPMRLEIQMTTLCNCNCPQCGYFTINKKDNISETEITSFMEVAIQNWGWVDRVLFEGGEPTMDFEKLLKCIQSAKRLCIPNIQINSNFINLNKQKISQLVEAGCNYFEISVDAVSEDLWCLMRGINQNGSSKYKQFMENLEIACKMPGVAVDFNYTPTIYNVHEFQQAYELACKLGVRYFSFQNLVCATKEIESMKVPIENLAAELIKCDDSFQIYKFPPTILMCCLEALQDGKKLDNVNLVSERFKCSCGEKYLYLNHKGEMRMCCFGDGLVLGNFFESDFSDVWNHRTEEQFTGCPVLVRKKDNLT